MNFRKIALLVFALALVGGIIGYKMYTKPHKEVTDSKADFSLSSADLYRAYGENEREANTKYLNKILEVKGTISTINTVDVGSSFVLDSGDPMGGITCEFESSDATKDLAVGQTVSVKGFCTGKLIDVVLTRCSVEKL